jgi:hypothetical protein
MTLPLGQRWLHRSYITVPLEPLESKSFGKHHCVNSLMFIAALAAAAAHSSVIVTDVIATGSIGRSPAPVGASAIASTTSSPRVTCPNSV